MPCLVTNDRSSETRQRCSSSCRAWRRLRRRVAADCRDDSGAFRRGIRRPGYHAGHRSRWPRIFREIACTPRHFLQLAATSRRGRRCLRHETQPQVPTAAPLLAHSAATDDAGKPSYRRAGSIGVRGAARPSRHQARAGRGRTRPSPCVRAGWSARRPASARAPDAACARPARVKLRAAGTGQRCALTAVRPRPAHEGLLFRQLSQQAASLANTKESRRFSLARGILPRQDSGIAARKWARRASASVVSCSGSNSGVASPTPVADHASRRRPCPQ